MSTVLTRLFPTPNFLALPVAGVDFSDATMRFVRLAQHSQGLLPASFGEATLPEGCLQGGKVVDEKRFTEFLLDTKKQYNLSYVRVAIPESQVYSFTLTMDISVAEDIRGAIELVIEDNIPLKVIETVFDYHVLTVTESNIVVQVAAVSEQIVNSFLNCFSDAGLIPVGFELDGQAAARALIDPHDKDSYMIVDFGGKRTGITIVTNGVAVYTSTLEFGGRILLQLLEKELGITVQEAEVLKREYGLAAGGGHKEVFSILVGGLSTMRDEINRRYIYWHERKGNFPAIKKVYLCGGHSNLKGLAEYLSVMLKLDVVLANPWRNCISFDDAIPSMSYDTAMSYVTSIGLSLADYLYE